MESKRCVMCKNWLSEMKENYLKINKNKRLIATTVAPTTTGAAKVRVLGTERRSTVGTLREDCPRALRAGARARGGRLR